MNEETLFVIREFAVYVGRDHRFVEGEILEILDKNPVGPTELKTASIWSLRRIDHWGLVEGESHWLPSCDLVEISPASAGLVVRGMRGMSHVQHEGIMPGDLVVEKDTGRVLQLIQDNGTMTPVFKYFPDGAQPVRLLIDTVARLPDSLQGHDLC